MNSGGILTENNYTLFNNLNTFDKYKCRSSDDSNFQFSQEIRDESNKKYIEYLTKKCEKTREKFQEKWTKGNEKILNSFKQEIDKLVEGTKTKQFNEGKKHLSLLRIRKRIIPLDYLNRGIILTKENVEKTYTESLKEDDISLQKKHNEQIEKLWKKFRPQLKYRGENYIEILREMTAIRKRAFPQSMEDLFSSWKITLT